MRSILNKAIVTIGLLGLAVAVEDNTDRNAHINLKDKCGADGACPTGFKCNEFKFCIAGEVEPEGGRCAADGTCPAGEKCNEFKFCVDAEPAPESV